MTEIDQQVFQKKKFPDYLGLSGDIVFSVNVRKRVKLKDSLTISDSIRLVVSFAWHAAELSSIVTTGAYSRRDYEGT